MRVPPLLVGGGAGLLGLLLLAPATGTALGRLASARAERGHAATQVRRAASIDPLVPAALAVSAPDASVARGAMIARVERLAKAGGVLVEQMAATDAPQGLAVLRIRVSGAEKAVLALADALERERPVVRLRRWSLEPVAGGGVRLSAEAVAPWR